MFSMLSVHDKNACNGIKWGREVLFPTNPDLANILGDMNFDFGIRYVLIPDFQIQVPRFPGRRVEEQKMCACRST